MKTVLIIQYSSQYDGSAISGLLLADGFKLAGWKTVVAFAQQGPMQSAYERNGHEVLTIFHRSWLRSTSIFRFTRNLITEIYRFNEFRRIFKRYSPHCVYLNTAVSFSAAFVAKFLNVPFIWHIRELFSDVGGEMEVPIQFRRGAQFILSNWASGIIVNSNAVAKNMLLPSYIDYKVVPNAIKEIYFNDCLSSVEARGLLDLNTEGYIIGVPGTLRPMKGHTYFIRAIAPLLRNSPNVRVIISGEGDLEYADCLKDLTKQLRVDKYITFLGQIDDMIGFYKACDLIVIPSRAEPFGRVVIESFACRVPIVATSVGGIPEIIRHRENGFLIQYGDESALRDTVFEVMRKPEYLSDMVELAYQDASRLYTVDQYQKSIISYVSKVYA